ncbi:RNA polymerase sigma factor [Paraflavitalea speifideaquila]|uniref:RNA polymerase sigma factor n=1 Tax=Paraflavitalea speifideaquila TaxID=3076558 RepID=UPI003312F888
MNIEKQLLIRVSKGDERAFEQLFNLYYNQIGDFIMRIVESKPLTQEIVQDVFLKIWISKDTLAEVESFRAYLFIVARNHTFNCLKQIARERNRKKNGSKVFCRT